ncbi:MAG: serine/threonine protein kinase [Planctomycetaceae bacterium]|nr:serine/threonine protein kinase [Planctomycetaceae bacterium]
MKQQLLVLMSLVLTQIAVNPAVAQQWHQFRGPGSRGISGNNQLPISWDYESREGIHWEVETEGRGWSSPIITSGKIYYTTVVNEGQTEDARKGLYFGGDRSKPPAGVHHWLVICRELKSGKLVWKKEVHKGIPVGSVHIKNSYASETAVTDGERLYVSFGHLGVFCLDLDGQSIWERRGKVAKTRHDWGTAASPVLYKDQLFIVDDNEEQSLLLALDKNTGKELWQAKRPEGSNWATPFVWENSRRTELVTPGTGMNRVYSLEGELLYEFGGNSSITIATPYAEDDLLFVSSGYVLDQKKPLFAIKPGASGDISLKDRETSNEYIAWCQKQAAPYNPSTVLYEGRIYVLYDRGFFACFDAKTGKEIYAKQRLNAGRAFTSSPWAYRGHVFCINEFGETYVIKAGDEFEVIGKNKLHVTDMAMATPSIADAQLIIRTAERLYSIRQK